MNIVKAVVLSGIVTVSCGLQGAAPLNGEAAKPTLVQRVGKGIRLHSWLITIPASLYVGSWLQYNFGSLNLTDIRAMLPQTGCSTLGQASGLQELVLVKEIDKGHFWPLGQVIQVRPWNHYGSCPDNFIVFQLSLAS